jgi:hypothetical protein
MLNRQSSGTDMMNLGDILDEAANKESQPENPPENQP